MIKDKYQELCDIESDINEHLPILYKYASTCSHVTEFGVRFGGSLWAFLASGAGKIIAYDFCKYKELDEIISITQKEKINFEFYKQDVLDADIEQTDLLFIDTFHHPLQLQRELLKHSGKVNKYIILHDTEKHKRVNEILWADERTAMGDKNQLEYDNYPNIGIYPVIIEFIYNHKEW